LHEQAIAIANDLSAQHVRLQMVWDNLRSAVFGMEALAHFGFEIRRLSTDVAIVAVCSLRATMSQKSSVPQAVSFVSQVLKRDTPVRAFAIVNE
jgi:hypothetical protein